MKVFLVGEVTVDTEFASAVNCDTSGTLATGSSCVVLIKQLVLLVKRFHRLLLYLLDHFCHQHLINLRIRFLHLAWNLLFLCTSTFEETASYSRQLFNFPSVRPRQHFLIFKVLYGNSIFICVVQIFSGIKDFSWKRYSSIAQILEVNIHEFETRLWCVQTVLCSTRGWDIKGTKALYVIEWSSCLVWQYLHYIRMCNGLYTFFVIFLRRRERNEGKFSQKGFRMLLFVGPESCIYKVRHLWRTCHSYGTVERRVVW